MIHDEGRTGNAHEKDNSDSRRKNSLMPSPWPHFVLTQQLQSRKPLQKVSEVPPLRAIEETSLEEPSEVGEERGKDSAELSDEDDKDEGFVRSFTTSASAFMRWVSRLTPLLRNQRVRRLAIVNFFLTVINSFAVIVALVLFGIFIHLRLQMHSGLDNNPCYFAYHEWSECSEPCWRGIGEVPYMTRRVRMDSVVNSRGSFEPCPPNLDKIVDKAPCNTYRCPTRISSYNFTQECFPSSSGHGGYRIRDIPLDDRLIIVDANLTEYC
ncbi:unnamed protein product [Toxocara canis]|uniref:LCCL domain-containing protein n=1 Tax=Toxocara canis TaxID=6265 RepID=A0A183V8P7_TOXCA|nr:unnamed protein product [Toxocara canis]